MNGGVPSVTATIYDVAERAGVGIATVSRVLNDSAHVREVTRKRVLAAIEQLEYSPSPFAQRLSSRRGLAIGVVVPYFTRPSFVDRMRGVEAAVTESEYDLVVFNAQTPQKRDVLFRSVSRRQRVDGLLIISLSPSDEDVQQFRDMGVAAVLVDAQHPQLPRVVADHVAGGALAARHLLQLGHRRIACVAGSPDSSLESTSVYDRYRGYAEAMGDAGFPVYAEVEAEGLHSRYQASVLTERLLDSPAPPTAIFAVSDLRAMGVLEALSRRGLKVPDAVSVVGYDDIEAAQYLALTTVRQHLYESGLRGVELLLKAMEEPDSEPVEVRLPLALVERQSCAPPHCQLGT
jgi:DNA-binding LacI/PurR family transcriptional regulator